MTENQSIDGVISKVLDQWLGVSAPADEWSNEIRDIKNGLRDAGYVVVRRDIVQRAVDEAIDGGRHYEIEAGLRDALEPKP